MCNQPPRRPPVIPSRRAFVVSLAGGALAILGRLVPRQRAYVAAAQADFHALGRAYFAAGGNRRRAAAFLRQTASTARRSGSSIGQVVRRRSTADFQLGNILLLDGWVVAESEALFCAGLAMSEALGG